MKKNTGLIGFPDMNKIMKKEKRNLWKVIQEDQLVNKIVVMLENGKPIKKG